MARKFDEKWGAYIADDDPLGRAMDSLMHRHVHSNGTATAEFMSNADGFQPTMNADTQEVIDDLERLAAGKPVQTEFVRTALTAAGFPADEAVRLTRRQTETLRDDVIAELRRRITVRNENSDLASTYECLLIGRDDEVVQWTDVRGGVDMTTVGDVRAALGMSVENFMSLDRKSKIQAIKRTTHKLRLRGARPVSRFSDERTALHVSLHDWARGHLRLEKPQSSSLHLMAEYDRQNTMGEFCRSLDDAQIVVVENDWGASVPPVAGEWRLPFPLMCWEFRISGVRVLAFTDCLWPASGSPQLYLIYGRDGHWVIDDFFYNVTGGAALGSGISHRVRSNGEGGREMEFRAVAEMVHASIRAVCIMMDAQVAHQEKVEAPAKLIERRRAEKRAPPRDHYVVRLFGAERRSYASRAKVAGRLSDARAPQRGHWRKGTWVHFDDPDSGQEQYVNDGGFVVSRTWRRWHFAGDPNNIIHREFRA
jgi:hypothetical protein